MQLWSRRRAAAADPELRLFSGRIGWQRYFELVISSGSCGGGSGFVHNVSMYLASQPAHDNVAIEAFLFIRRVEKLDDQTIGDPSATSDACAELKR